MTTHEEESEITLEEKIKILQDKDLPPKKIVEEILKEDLTADVNILANTLNLDKMEIGRIKGRLSRLKKQRARKQAKAEAHEEGPLYKGELDTTKILEEILNSHPDISPKIVKEVLSWADYGPIHPTQLVYLLQSMKGVSNVTANVVAQKYNLALQRAQQEGKQLTPPLAGPMPSQPGLPQAFPTNLPSSMPSGMPSGIPGAPQYAIQPNVAQYYGATPYGAPPPYGSWPPPQQPQDVRAIFKDEMRALEERLKPKEEKYVEIEEPWRDEDGQLVVGRDHQVIMRRMRVPASQAANFAPREDAELGILAKIERYKKIFGVEELTPDKVREIIREERPTTPSETEKPITREAVTEAAKEAATQVLEAREKEDKEEKRHREIIGAIERSSSAKTVEGYRDDSFRFLGQGLHEIAQKKPIEIIIKDGGRLLFGGQPVPAKDVEPGAGQGLLERLKERGWVVDQ